MGIAAVNTYLPSLFAASDSTGSADLLSILAGSGPSGGVSGAASLAALQSAEANQTKDIAAVAAQPAVARDVAAFRSAVASATDASALLKNPTALKVLLTANGLADEASYAALARKALLSDTTDSKSLANTLTDTRWKSVAATYDFANQGLAILRNPNVLDTVTNAYAEVTWRQSLDSTTPGLSNALTFRAGAKNVTSVDDILADPVLRTVVTTALGIPEQIAFQPLEAQEKAISTRLDLGKLKDAKFVENFAKKYLLAAAANASSTASGTSLVTLAVQASSLVV